MKLYFLLLCVLYLPNSLQGQKQVRIITEDITQFWLAFDQLEKAKTHTDSVNIMQHYYIDSTSTVYQKYIERSNITAEEYITLFTQYPQYWLAIRPLTENIVNRSGEIQSTIHQLAAVIPEFTLPEIYFGIGCLRQGGTIKGNTIIIGAELAAADSLTDKSEISPWLQSVVGKTGDIVGMVAHESIHVQQTWFPLREIFSLAKHQQLRLLNMAILEGSADYITDRILQININAPIYAYGIAYECAIWKAFEQSIAENPFDYSKWLYNGDAAREMPADMGYFIGYQITQAYFNYEQDTIKAYRTIFKRAKYNKVFERSGYQHSACM